MDAEWLHSLYTVLAFVTFVVIGLWAWSARNRAGFEEAARLPLLDDDTPAKRVGASREDKA